MKKELGLMDPAWSAFLAKVRKMSACRMGAEQASLFFASLLAQKDKPLSKPAPREHQTMNALFKSAPGQKFVAAKGTLWGAVSAVPMHPGCIFPDLENSLGQALQWVSRGAVLGQREYTRLAVPGGEGGATVSLMAWPKDDLRANYAVVRDKQSGRAYLHTAFPAAASGCRHNGRIDSVD